MQGECEEESFIEVDSIVQVAEERSNRRAAAIRGVLAQLRPQSAPYPGSPDELPPMPLGVPSPMERSARRVHAQLEEEVEELEEDEYDVQEEEPLPQPRAHPPPAPVPMPFSGGIGGQVAKNGPHIPPLGLEPREPREPRPRAVASVGGEQRRIPGLEVVQAVPPAQPKGAALEQRRLMRHCGQLEEQLEQHQRALDRTRGTLESEQVAAQEAHEGLLKMEAEAAYAESMSARREAELRTEVLSLRAEHQRERDRLRSEARRMQSSLKDMQARVKSEVQARTVATAQAESLKEQLVAARTDTQKRGKEGQEAKAVFATLEKRLEQYQELFQWVSSRCAETLGEDAVHELHSGGSSGTDAIDGLRRIVGRTFTLLLRQSGIDTDGDKENTGNTIRAPRSKKPSLSATEAAQRLATVQGELLNHEVQNEELMSRQRVLQERLCESEEALQAAHSRPGFRPSLQTEHRGRLRAAEDGQKKLQKQLTQNEDELKWQYARYEEEHERMRSRLSALQRAKEAGERYIEGEEDAWINAQRQERALHSEYARFRSEINDAEADAREARADAVEARAASQMIAVTKKRLEVDLEELQTTVGSLPTTARSVSQDQSVVLAAQACMELETVENVRSELSTLREEAQCVGRRSQELEQETELFRRRIAEEERNTAEWYTAAEIAEKEGVELRQALNEQAQAAQSMQQEFQAAMERQQTQQAKIDEKKRVMVNTAMAEQENTLKQELAEAISCIQAEANTRYQEAVRQLQHCADEHQEQMLQLNYGKKSLAFYQHQAHALESELHQQKQDLTSQEQRICEFGRAELTAMTAQQEAHLQAHVCEKTEQMIADALASAQVDHDEEVSLLHDTHAAKLAAVQGECSGELEAMRYLEIACRDELATARLAFEAEAAGDETIYLEEEQMRAAQRSVKDEAAELRMRGHKLRGELKKELFDGWHNDLWTDSYAKARQNVLEDVRGNPRNKLRQELCRDMRQELSDQLRAEVREEMRSELDSCSRLSVSASSAANGSPPRQRSRQHSRNHGSSGAAASPSSIGACSTVGSSPACAASALLVRGLTPERVDQPFTDLMAAVAEQDMMSGKHPQEEVKFTRRDAGVLPAPPTGRGMLDFREQVRPTNVFRQYSDPSGPPSWLSSSKLDGMLPRPPPEHASGLDLTFSALPQPPELPTPPTPHFKSAPSLPQPPPHGYPSTSFQDQASAVLEMVSRSRAPFRSTTFPRSSSQGSTGSFGHLPPWPPGANGGS